MSDDAPAPGAGEHTGDGTPPAGSSTPDLWPAPADGGAEHVAPQDGSLVDARTTETRGAAPGPRAADTSAPSPAPDPWAVPEDRPPTPGTASGRPAAGGPAAGGPGETVVAGETSPWSAPAAPSGATAHDRPAPARPGGAPAAPPVHDQQTVTSFPAAGNPAPSPQYGTPWAGPSAAPAAVPHSAHPPATNPFAPPVTGSPVPPPPLGPEGPGQVPYGYPGTGYAGAPAAHTYAGWAPLPSNGLGVAAMVLGIISAAGFCLWPLAIVLGVLAVIFGAIGRGKANRGEATNAGQALAGVICGAVGSALGIAFGILVLTT
ncbi:DUF4190 domain-containing protein [Streptomyces sp. NPDC057092]|uniref:DUF4190 domain-containing protein n=1 Tax=Streptomyces sp. NPDC057092 TaxID=3346017 RepID=UPI003627EE08